MDEDTKNLLRKALQHIQDARACFLTAENNLPLEATDWRNILWEASSMMDCYAIDRVKSVLLDNKS